MRLLDRVNNIEQDYLRAYERASIYAAALSTLDSDESYAELTLAFETAHKSVCAIEKQLSTYLKMDRLQVNIQSETYKVADILFVRPDGTHITTLEFETGRGTMPLPMPSASLIDYLKTAVHHKERIVYFVSYPSNGIDLDTLWLSIGKNLMEAYRTNKLDSIHLDTSKFVDYSGSNISMYGVDWI